MSAMIHIAGISAHVDQHLRQRCCWCGICIIDVHLERTAVEMRPEDSCGSCGVTREVHAERDPAEVDPRKPAGHDFVEHTAYPTWETGVFVVVDGGMQYVLEPAPAKLGDLEMPCCMTEHPELSG